VVYPHPCSLLSHRLANRTLSTVRPPLAAMKMQTPTMSGRTEAYDAKRFPFQASSADRADCSALTAASPAHGAHAADALVQIRCGFHRKSRPAATDRSCGASVPWRSPRSRYDRSQAKSHRRGQESRLGSQAGQPSPTSHRAERLRRFGAQRQDPDQSCDRRASAPHAKAQLAPSGSWRGS
jgi:hypothetical protein